mgnify:CR=1 FL=1
MRTTLDLEEDVLLAAKQLARMHGLSTGRVISDLARKGFLRSSKGPTGGFSLRIPAKDLTLVMIVDSVDGLTDYVTIPAGPRELVIRETLGSLERKLDPKTFARVHRSYIVNVTRVKQLHPLFHGEYELVLQDGTRIGTGSSRA